MSECSDCRWYGKLDLNYGECHARAPVGGINLDPDADVGEGHLYVVCWPIVPANDHCGEHLDIPGLGDVLAHMSENRPEKKRNYQSMADIRETLRNRRKRVE